MIPLQSSRDMSQRGNIFLAFANEGDPIIRADRDVVKSLVKLYVSPTPKVQATPIKPPGIKRRKSSRWLCMGDQDSEDELEDSELPTRTNSPSKDLIWHVPQWTLKPAGRLVLLRERIDGLGPEDIEACHVNDRMLESVVFGDPMYHSMNIYAQRMDTLAKDAVTLRE
jgi:hypothetical protein